MKRSWNIVWQIDPSIQFIYQQVLSIGSTIMHKLIHTQGHFSTFVDQTNVAALTNWSKYKIYYK